MKKLNVLFAGILCMLVSGIFAQKTAMFNGKRYFVYPQMMDAPNYSEMRPGLSSGGSVTNILFPPVIGTHTNGEYLIYSGHYTLINKRKRDGWFVYDTIWHVYGTFVLMDNKREGLAHIYSDYNQKQVIASIPYKNDLVDGKWRLYDWYSRQYEPMDFYSHQDEYADILITDKLTVDHIMYRITASDLVFREGLLTDSIKTFRVFKKDTVLGEVVHIRNGERDGMFKRYGYSVKKKKIQLKSTVTGYYKANKKHGTWSYRDASGMLIQEKEYNEDKLVSYKVYLNGRLYHAYLYGRDSVLKYFPDPSQHARMKYVVIYRNREKPVEKVIIYRKDNELKKAFIIDNHASANYYSEFRNDGSAIRDSAAGDKTYRFTTSMADKGRKVIVMSRIDSCWSMVQGITYNRFCSTNLWWRTYDKNGKLKYEHKTNDFYIDAFMGDSFSLHTLGSYKGKDWIVTSRYYPVLNATYKDYVFTSGKNKGSRVFYKAGGKSSSSSLIRYISLIYDSDSVLMADTLIFKGKALYGNDLYFEQMFDTHLKDYYSEDRNPLSYYISEFFKVAPVKHTTLFTGKSVFTGMLNVKVHASNKPHDVKMQMFEYIAFEPFEMKESITIELYGGKWNRKAGSGAVFIMPIKEKELFVHMGLFSDDFKAFDMYNRVAYKLYYNNNKILSSAEASLYKMQKSKKQRRRHYRTHDYHRYRHRNYTYYKIKRKHIAFHRSVDAHFSSGSKTGQWHIYKGNSLSNALNFRNNKLNGIQYMAGPTAFTDILSYRNDTLDGRSYYMSMYGDPRSIANFKKGVLQGDFYYYTGDTSGPFRKKILFDSGWIRHYTERGDSGELKMEIALDRTDSMYHSPYKSSTIFLRSTREQLAVERDVYFLRDLPAITPSRGYFTYYYKSGTVFKYGRKKNSKPVGKWTFYREGKDRLYKEIEFKDTVLHANTPDSMHIYGYTKAYYDDGRLMFRGYALDKRSQHSCEAGSDLPIEENHYLEFYDTLGNSILKEGSGFVTEYQASGYKLKEGRIDSFKRQGVWIYYSKFGLPDAIGAYKNGKKNGRWLFGDLGGLNISEEICYMSDEQFRAWIMLYGDNLTLTEMFFADGRFISSNTVHVIKK